MRISVKIFVLSILYCSFVQGQTLMDTLSQKLQLATTDSVRTQIYLEMGKCTYRTDADAALSYIEKAHAISLKTANAHHQIQAEYTMGMLYVYNFSKPREGVEWLIKAQKLSEHHKDSSFLGEILYSIGIIQVEQGDTLAALNTLIHNVSVCKQKKDFDMVAMTNILLGNFSSNATDKHKYFTDALNAAEKNPENVLTLFQTWKYLGDYYHDQKQYAKSRGWYSHITDRGYQECEDEQYMRAILSTAYLRVDSLELAKREASFLIELANVNPSAGNWHLVDALEVLSDVHYKQGNYLLAYEVSKRRFEVNDSLNSLRTSADFRSQLARMHAEYDLNKNKHALELMQTKSKYQTRQSILLGFLILLFSGTTYYFYRVRQREQKQKELLTRYNQTKDKLLSIISHDIRSPLKAMQNILHLYEEQIVSSEDIRTVTIQARETIDNLYKNLDNLLIWTQNQQEELTAAPELTDVSKIILDQYPIMSEWVAHKHIQIINEVPQDLHAMVDPVHLRLILQNLISNALKFSYEHGKITISAKKTAHEMVQIDIQDEGVGIPLDAENLILDPSVRYTRAGTANEPGSGLGISLSKGILQLNKGDLRFSKNGEKGTIASIILPLK